MGIGTTIVAHDNVRPLLEKSQTLMGQSTKVLPVEALPGITYADKLTLYSGDVPVRLVHYAHAHTNGDTVVFIDKYKVLHKGCRTSGFICTLDQGWVSHNPSMAGTCLSKHEEIKENRRLRQ